MAILIQVCEFGWPPQIPLFYASQNDAKRAKTRSDSSEPGNSIESLRRINGRLPLHPRIADPKYRENIDLKIRHQLRSSGRILVHLNKKFRSLQSGPDRRGTAMSRKKNNDEIGAISRRGFLKGAGLAAAAVGTGSIISPIQEEANGIEKVAIVSGDQIPVSFTMNGKKIEAMSSPSTTLLDFIRGPLDHTGTKRVCDRGSCGACTVLINGKSACSCSYLAVDAHGQKIQTVEGLANGETLNPLQQSFVECDAMQCGFCTPGMLMSCTALLDSNAKPTRAEIAQGISGNLCRCGTYQNIFEAVEQTATGEKK
ncbi:MAG: xanthine dehydrogenase YagT iron-sulfur-binding subunit [Planctomycetota bacterium]|jgi:xanthine dehydrogenase YagT iron-sulfur-binding subunit